MISLGWWWWYAFTVGSQGRTICPEGQIDEIPNVMDSGANLYKWANDEDSNVRSRSSLLLVPICNNSQNKDRGIQFSQIISWQMVPTCSFSCSTFVIFAHAWITAEWYMSSIFHSSTHFGVYVVAVCRGALLFVLVARWTQLRHGIHRCEVNEK